MISAEEAQKKILNSIKKFEVKNLDILGCLGLALAQDIKINKSMPIFDSALKSGYAVRAIDIKGADVSYPVRLKIIESSKEKSMKIIEPGFCYFVTACDKIPKNCDCIVATGDVELTGNDLLVYKECKRGENILFRSADITKSNILLKKGKIITPEDIYILSFLGIEKIKVFYPPNIGIITVGLGKKEKNKQLHSNLRGESNSYLLAAKLNELAIPNKRFGNIKSNINKKIEEALSKCDILLIYGQAVEARDLLLSLGAEIVFWDVNQKPYHNFSFFVFKDKKIFVLPRNPASIIIYFEIYLKPFIKKIMKHKKLFPRKVKAKSLNEINHKKGITNFELALLFKKEGELYFELINEKYSSRLTSLINIDGIVKLPASAGVIRKNFEADLFLIKENEKYL